MLTFVASLSESERWFYGLITTAIIIFGGHWFAQRLSHALTVKREQNSRFKQAASTFRSRVLAELEGLYPIPSNWPKDGLAIYPIMEKKFPRLQTAVVEFKKILPWYKKKAFEDAWFRFYNGSDRESERECQNYNQYIGFSGKPYKEKFKHNVDNLLKFAKLS